MLGAWALVGVGVHILTAAMILVLGVLCLYKAYHSPQVCAKATVCQNVQANSCFIRHLDAEHFVRACQTMHSSWRILHIGEFGSHDCDHHARINWRHTLVVDPFRGFQCPKLRFHELYDLVRLRSARIDHGKSFPSSQVLNSRT